MTPNEVSIDFIKKSLHKTEVIPMVKVTPALATELIKMNTSNRPVRTRKVLKFANEMTNNKWIFNGDTVRFARSGYIQDGQHRLLSVIKSGTTQVWNLQLGLEEEAYPTIDTGTSRTAGDVLNAEGYKNTNNMAGMARIAMASEFGYLDRDPRTLEPAQRPSNAAILEWVVEKGKAFTDCAQDAIYIYGQNKKILTSTVLGGFLWILSRKNKSHAYEFFTKLVTGEDISSKNFSSIYALRERFIQWRGNEGINSVERYATIIKAWNAYRKGEDVKRLKWQANEEFPKVK